MRARMQISGGEGRGASGGSGHGVLRRASRVGLAGLTACMLMLLGALASSASAAEIGTDFSGGAFQILAPGDVPDVASLGPIDDKWKEPDLQRFAEQGCIPLNQQVRSVHGRGVRLVLPHVRGGVEPVGVCAGACDARHS